MRAKKFLLLVSVLFLAASVPLDAQDNSFLTNGLMIYFPFDGSTSDASGNGNNGTAFNVSFAANRFGITNTSALFNGVNSRVALTKSLPDSTNFTVSAWVSCRQENGERSIFSDSTGAPGQDLEFRFIDRKLAVVSIKDNGGGTPLSREPFGPNFLTSNRWFHVVWVKSETNTSIFADGNLLISESGNFAGNIGFHGGSVGCLDQSGSRNFFFDGFIDDFRFYNRALSAQEVLQLYAIEVANLGIVALPTLTLQGVSNRTYRIEYRTNLTDTNWTALVTNIFFTNGSTYIFPDTNGLYQPRRFYRAVSYY